MMKFTVERVDRIEGNRIAVSDQHSLRDGFPILKALLEQDAVIKAYKAGKIILKFDWEFVPSELAHVLFITLGEVTWSEKND